MTAEHARTTSLPARRHLTLPYALSVILAVVIVAASLVGVLVPSRAYPSDALRQSLVPTDIVNLLIGLPILLGSMGLARRGKLVGLLLWPGALFFVLYTYVVYLFAVPFNVAFLLHLTLVILSLYSLIGLLASLDGEAVHRRLAGAVPERAAGGILAGLGILFLVRVVGVLASALIQQTSIASTELAPHIGDALAAPALAIGGVLLWRRAPFGYVAGLGLLFQASMLFIGLIIFLLVQPLVTAVPLALIDIVVVSILSLICLVPLALFVRGVASADSSPPR